MSLFDRLDAATLPDLLVAMLLVVVAILAWMVREARREMEQQCIRAEEMAMWAELQIEEINALRKRLAEVERRYENLQALYAGLVRHRLAASFPLIESNIVRQRRRK